MPTFPSSTRKNPVLPSKTSFIDHVRWLRWAAGAHDAQVLIELESMRAFVRKDDRHWVLQPRFSTEVDGIPQFFTHFATEADHVAGWAPAQAPTWPCAKDKLTFKRAAMQSGLPVPAYTVDEQSGMADVLVKRAVDMHGQHVHGPYRSSAERPLRIELGEYFERFVPGHALKIWYLDSQPVALEQDAPPTVVGDGRSSFQALIHERVRARPRITPKRLERILERCATVLRYDGLALDDIPEKDHVQRVEFRHGCEVMELSDRQTVDLQDNSDPQWQVLRDAGPKLAQLLPQGMKAATMFTVDAVLAADGGIWMLQMTSQPVVHPLMYDPLIRRLVSMPIPSPARSAEAL
jgi:hypothetical protein